MAQILKPKPISKAFETVELVHGSEWRWSVKHKFTAEDKIAFDNVRYDACSAWIIEQIKKNEESKPKQEEYVSPFAEGVERAITTAVQMQYIPDEATVGKYIKRFFYGNNTEVRKKQMDIICRPIAGAPLASKVIESGEADEDVVESIFDFFYEAAFGIKATSKADSGQSENSSTETIDQST